MTEVLVGIAGLVIGIGIGFLVRKAIATSQVHSAEARAQKVVLDAQVEAKTVMKQSLVDGNEQIATINSFLAMKLRDEGKIEEARAALLRNADYLLGNATRYKSEELERSVRIQRVHPAAGVAQVGQALIGEKQVAVLAERKIVQAFEAFVIASSDVGLYRTYRQIRLEQAVSRVRDPRDSISAEFQSARFAVVFQRQSDLAARRRAENAPERHVGKKQISGSVDRRPLQKAVGLGGLVFLTGYARRFLPSLAMYIRQLSEYLRRHSSILHQFVLAALLGLYTRILYDLRPFLDLAFDERSEFLR